MTPAPTQAPTAVLQVGLPPGAGQAPSVVLQKGLPPGAGRCSFFVSAKQRFCSWPPLAGETVCGHHTQQRVPCPLDPRHTVHAAELEAHLLVCPVAVAAAEASRSAYLSADVNGGSDCEGESDAARSYADAVWRSREGDSSSETARSAVASAVSLVMSASSSLEDLPPPADVPDCVERAASAAAAASEQPHACVPFELRHTQQQAGILAHAAAAGLLPPLDDTVYVELGAGRGMLSALLADAYSPDGPVRLLLVERRAYRYKAERALRRAANVSLRRLRCSIDDLDLTQAPLPCDGPARVVLLCKHLCGSATDAALRSGAVCAAAGMLRGGALATCCHHACTWRAFCGKARMLALGFDARSFALVCRVASWAFDSAHDTVADDGSDSRWGLSLAQRRASGLAAKRLLDGARAEWAAQHCGMHASLVRFCDAQVSPENRLLVLRGL